jgi:hypothetical protein
MRRSAFRLYGPFAAIVLVQALLILVAPSTAPNRTNTFAGGVTPGGAVDPETGAPVAGTDATTGGTGGTGGAAPGDLAAGGGGAGVGGAAGAGSPGGGGTPGQPGGAAAGDTSHCVGDRQFDILLNNPACIPNFEGDNGGATYTGVSAESVRVVIFESEPNEAVNAVLAPQGLAATEEDLQNIYAAGEEFIEAHYELYGRELELIRFQGPCPTTPPDVPACLEAAREVVRMQPFMVVFGTPLYDRVFDEWARAGIISIGGWHFDNSYFTAEGRRGLRYDLFMDGTRSAQMIAEYYCVKLAGGTATRAGSVIHPTIGGRNTPRRLGITVPEIDANIRTAEHVAALVQQCDPGADPPVISTYQSDIERAAEQTNATTQRFIAEKVTTVTCMCDPIAPAFQTNGFTQQGYFPEYLMPGLGLLDYDKLGRLYDPQQMTHAFGPGHLAEPIPFTESDAARMWRATGRSGQPCQSCNLYWGYTGFVGSILHYSGPNLNPATVEEGVLNGIESYGGDRVGTQFIEFGADDYTALSDAREIYWCATCTSRIDGQAGAYISPNNARRYRLGQWEPGLDQIPVAPS